MSNPSSMRQRLLDLALLLPSLPFFAVATSVLALLVLVRDGRPVFFTQPRVGRHRRPFRIYKLRTMSTEADVAARRPTALGAWLRARGLDELPQLFNVLKGDMALVGPRPLEPKDAERLVERHPPFAARFSVRPGLTGPAQVAQVVGVEATAALESQYAQGRTAWVDVRLLAQTVWINLVGKRRGARRLRLLRRP
jgi:lipopolysaccharide/colanic/teichoic acid biosynthesis glycosyltransferase